MRIDRITKTKEWKHSHRISKGLAGRGVRLSLLAIIDNGLDEDPPALTISVRVSGTVTWDFDTGSTAPTPGNGDIDTGSFAVVAGINEVEITLAAGEGYLYLSHSEGGDSIKVEYPGGGTIVVSGGITNPLTLEDGSTPLTLEDGTTELDLEL